MKNPKIYLSFFVIAIVSVLFSSCLRKAPLVESPPKVTISTPTYVGLDTISVQGTIVSNGNSDITVEGFVYSTNPSFSASTEQIYISGSQINFSSRINAIHYNTYYFKAFATNEKGTVYSDVIQYTVPAPPPATAPCSLTTNVITNNGITYNATVMGNNSSSWGSYEVYFYGTNQDVYVYFPSIPHNGIYKTVADPSDIVEGQVSISMPSTLSGPYSIDGGQSVYVALDTTAHTTNITFCSLSYNLGGLGTTYLSGKGSY